MTHPVYAITVNLMRLIIKIMRNGHHSHFLVNILICVYVFARYDARYSVCVSVCVVAKNERMISTVLKIV
jgi:hypothetical protein